MPPYSCTIGNKIRPVILWRRHAALDLSKDPDDLLCTVPLSSWVHGLFERFMEMP